jgi:hypothetical protein
MDREIDLLEQQLRAAPQRDVPELQHAAQL